LRAILRAGAEGEVAIIIPFVTGRSDVVRVRRALIEERQALLKKTVACAESVMVGAMVEVPAAAIAMTGLLREVDFAVIGLDDLLQYMLAADRDNALVRDYYQTFHPAAFEILSRIANSARRRGTELVLSGEAASDPLRLPFYVGIGIDRLSVAPARLTKVREVLEKWGLAECEELAQRVLAAPTALDVQRVLLAAER
jgi:phosphotransferase system enzyme I (PtsI)